MRSSNNFNELPYFSGQLTQSRYFFDADLGAAFFYMRPQERPCFSPTLLKELRVFQKSSVQQVQVELNQHGKTDLKYTVLASDIPDIFNLGGDLHLFLELIQQGNRQALLDYAELCIHAGYEMSTSMNSPITTIALIEGNAHGGGLEAALSCNVIIAERGVQMGFPEVLFNLFPGMGAYSYLRQRVNPSLAESIILSGKSYASEEMHEMGLVDFLAEPGCGHEKLAEYIKQANRRSHANSLIRHTRRKYNTVSYEELHDITSRWVDAAMNIGEREMRTINRLVRAQNRRVLELKEEPVSYKNQQAVDS